MKTWCCTLSWTPNQLFEIHADGRPLLVKKGSFKNRCVYLQHFCLSCGPPKIPWSNATPRSQTSCEASGQAVAKPAARPAVRPTCEIENVYRSWRDSIAVRHVAVRNDRLFEFPKPKDGSELKTKISIKTAVHNQYVLIPLLAKMAEHTGHPLPKVKPLARETNLSFWIDVFIFHCLCIFPIPSCTNYIYIYIYRKTACIRGPKSHDTNWSSMSK